MIRFLNVCLALLSVFNLQAQAWPASPWTNGINLTNIMDAAGVNDLSGLHFNPVNNRLYAVQNDGRVRVLQWNAIASGFTQIANKTIEGGPEGITQANLSANEFYTMDENNYEIRRYTYTANFSSVTEFKHWNLLNAPSPMEDTGNTGPEGIVFVPDSFLSAAGFISEQTGQLYTSTKGLGGLFFVAHQDGGYVWVFDVNPNTNNDFAYVGKYKTSREESCDLAFDRSTGLLYILHNISGNNKLEVTNLSSGMISGERKFAVTNEFNIPDTFDANDNIEGFALVPKCETNSIAGAWLCRDVGNNDESSILQSALRWFHPFEAAGNCTPLAAVDFTKAEVQLYPNPVNDELTVSNLGTEPTHIRIYNNLGQLMVQKENQSQTTLVLETTYLQSGIYMLEIKTDALVRTLKFLKQ
ncbi:T9SS type A sorting domain-containing protein [Flavobacterium sp. CYK-4]|uniref:T9SS type A sorting domain-containing protein n=1 Tax=Flavobacterium lotistagni TaxID=2709660 RepID=UPI00140C7055|nr:T9SS type A sorting domain-containing protein [Flavobacterium lotistagni]NHM06207.1 T9SS type A sorting domain-containing protein [Flavobacterium lotistagni]